MCVSVRKYKLPTSLLNVFSARSGHFYQFNTTCALPQVHFTYPAIGRAYAFFNDQIQGFRLSAWQ